ncbi:protein trichome birefringence-like 6 [Typha angustifolia]|uniref:protein trichome birefringence-like 6 n=1 Tax=Typha angustifolia TaxID=59011 RepID=UPI003C2CC44C
MERLRSFSIKPRRVVVTISFSLLFCFLFSFWVLNINPLGSTEAHLQYIGGLKSIKGRAFAPPSSNLSGDATEVPVLEEAHMVEVANLSGEALDSRREVEDAILVDGYVINDGDSTRGAVNPVFGEKDAILNDYFPGRANTSSEENLHSVEVKRIGDLTGAHRLKSSDVSREGLDSSIEGANNAFDGERLKNEKFEEQNLNSPAISSTTFEQITDSVAEKKESEVANHCDIYDGNWVLDETYPLYASKSCPFIDEGFSCEANGRVDAKYMKWRWQPHHCSIPRFNPVKMLEMIKGKRLVFVGDSINRNQWESMMCLLQGAISDPTRVREARGRKITKERGNYKFKFLDYNCSVEYYVTHFLAHESKARIGQRRVKTLRIDTIDKSSSRWRGADMLVFNTAHWWSHQKTKAGVNYYQEGDQVHSHLDVSIAFQKALKTWASWVEQHVNPRRTQVFFRSSAPSHFSGGEWNSGGHCRESTQPLNDTSGRQVTEKNLILEEVVKQMKTPVTILNITNLSGLRIDGHPSIYGRNPGKGPPSSIQDCSHWCLPGVPDTWNELLYSYLIARKHNHFL